LNTLDLPEWPITEHFLNVFAHTLAHWSQNPNVSNSLKSTSIDYLGKLLPPIRQNYLNYEKYSEDSTIENFDILSKVTFYFLFNYL